jgi:hypothetical protein
MSRILGGLTVAGLGLIAVAIALRFAEAPYPYPITLLCAGVGCSLVAGMPWAHLPGNRRLKMAYLGLIGFAVGGAIGFFIGYMAAPTYPDFGPNPLYLVFGFWSGGILAAILGVKWGQQIHRTGSE